VLFLARTNLLETLFKGIIMKKLFTLICTFLLFGFSLTAQEWEQTGGIPEGGGVTEIAYVPGTNTIFVSTDQFNWPDSNLAGIRRSTDGGATWENLIDGWAARTITYAADGNLYASVWPSPAKEGIYRSSDNGDTWEILDSTSSGNRYFAFAVDVNVTPHIIYAATWTGVKRSMDNGETWDWANEGILFGAQSNDIAIDSNGVVAVGTTHGLYISDDNGDTWVKATGDGIENKEITSVIFGYSSNKALGNASLSAGTKDGSLYALSDGDSQAYLAAVLSAAFSQEPISDQEMINLRAVGELIELRCHAVTTAPFSEVVPNQGFHSSKDDDETWEQNNNGLAGNPSQNNALGGYSTEEEAVFIMGLYEYNAEGAKIYTLKINWDAVGIEENTISAGLTLQQNIPNPFVDNTLINYRLNKSGKVTLSVYASNGQLVQTLVDGQKSKGGHQVTFNAEELIEGVYYYKLETEGSSEVRKMVVLK